MLSFIYRYLKNKRIRQILQYMIASTDGGFAFSHKIRILYSEIHDIHIGYGTYGGCLILIIFQQK